ncbi:MAG: type II secretion system protein [Actinomycetota bacterium]|nr:type II secretion system protein [Actinomycetota bacterium]
MYSFRKSKKGFTLIELMVVVAIIGVLALLGLRLYTGQQAKAKNAIVKANCGTIQTLIQAELADHTAAEINGSTAPTLDSIIDDSGIHNPFGDPTGAEATDTDGTQSSNPANPGTGEVYVTYSDPIFSINGIGADGTNVYTPSLTAQP